MAHTIVTKNSSTASSVPSTGSLVQGELAVNVTDKKLFTKDSGGSVVTLADYINTVTLTGTQTLTNKTLTSPTSNNAAIVTPTITGTKETRVAMGANNVDMTAGNYFTKTISGTTTLTVSNVPASGTAGSFILDLTNGGSATITWWSGMKWAGGTAPTLTAAGRDVLGFFTHDAGTTWSGLVLGKDVK